jgi:cyclic pyranopterin phosphate synthase
MPEERVKVTSNNQLMQPEEIILLANMFISLGINKIRLTGGEPLVRNDAAEIIKAIGKLPIELTISTNGVLVDEFIGTFKEAGIRSVNVSLDALNAGDFLAITRQGHFQRILDNIYRLLKNNFHVKVNTVVMKGVNEKAIPDFVEWTKDFSLDVRFIEFMPFSGNQWEWEKVFSLDEILSIVGKDYSFVKIPAGPNDTTKYFRAAGHLGTFGVISTMTEPFCATCNRLRLTADGKMKNCLFSTGEINLLKALRNGEDVIQLIQRNVYEKKKERGGQLNFEHIQNRAMVAIGG